MKKHNYSDAIYRAVDAEYSAKAPAALRVRIQDLMQLPLMKPWQFIGSVALLFATPLCFFLFSDRLVYSNNLLLFLNVASGFAGFLIIFAGVAHHYRDPRHKADLLDRLSALRARI